MVARPAARLLFAALAALSSSAPAGPEPSGDRLDTIRRSEDPSSLGELARQNADPSVREAAVSRLVQIATAHVEETTSAAAVAELEADALLARVARLSRHERSRALAAARVNDPTLLSWLAEHAEDETVRIQVIARSTDQELMIRIATGRESSRLRRAAVARIDDDLALGRIALRDNDLAVQHAAIAAVRDPVVLEGIARESFNGENAVDRIDQPEVLADLARTAVSSIARRRAVARLENADLLEDVVFRASYAEAILALEKLGPDSAFVERVLSDHPERKVRVAAVRRIENQERLIELVRSSPDVQVRMTAASRIAEPAVALEIVRSAEDEVVSLATLPTLEDPSTLFQLATTHPKPRVRVAVVQRLRDVDQLVAIAEGDVESVVRRAAVSGLLQSPPKPGSEAALLTLATRAPHADVRKGALYGITDEAELAKIEKNDPDPGVRAQARARRDHLDPPTPFGVGLLFGYRYGVPLGHEGSFGLLIGDARTSMGSSSSLPVPSFPGTAGTGALVQVTVTQRGVKLGAGFGRLVTLYVPPVSFGWALKGTYLVPFEDSFSSTRYAGVELEAAYWITVSIGVLGAVDGSDDVLVIGSVGIGF